VSAISYSTLIPPAVFILLASIGVVLAWFWRRTGLALATAATLSLYAVSAPVVASLLIRSVEVLAHDETSSRPPSAPGAIIVLAADTRPSSDPQNPDTVGPLTLERILGAVRQARRLNLPLLVSGGEFPDYDVSLAAMMADVIEHDFGMPVKWREEQSVNTFQNARFSAEILRRAGVGAAYVVTHRWHMARALLAFNEARYPVVPLPVEEEVGALPYSTASFLPSIPALRDSYYALHELIGLAWYRLRYGG
jgi:uncharacterized SAM-binding protein YcdF (DUF218 family)